MNWIHLVFYSYYRTATKINKFIPLKGEGIGASGIFLGMLVSLPLIFSFKLSRKTPLTSLTLLYYIICLLGIAVVIFYFDIYGKRIVKKMQENEHSDFVRRLIANAFLVVYFLLFYLSLR